MRLITKLTLIFVAMCAIAELIILHSFGLLDYRDRVQARVAEVSIRPIPIFAERDARAVQVSVLYTYKGVNYSALVEERLHSLRYENLESSDLYLALVTAMRNGSTIGLAIYPERPALPRLFPDLHLARIYGYLISAFIGVFIFGSIKGKAINEQV